MRKTRGWRRALQINLQRPDGRPPCIVFQRLCKFLGAPGQCMHVFVSRAAMTRALERETCGWRRVQQINLQ